MGCVLGVPFKIWHSARLCLSFCAAIGCMLLAFASDVHAATRPKQERAANSAMAERRAVLGAARSWAYQLRITDLAPLAAENADILVIDHGYAARRDGKIIFDAADVARLKFKHGGQRRRVLAYLSIGEAEQYRFYWQGAWCSRTTAPGWMGPVNTNWPGNYPVRFWDKDWQALILDPVAGYLARIQAQGFDGIYLDRTDVYQEWQKERPDAERDMIAFLGRIAAAARANDPNFLVVMQNAEELLVHGGVRRLLDGVAKEDLLYGVTFTEAPNDADTVANALKDLRRARADGIPVFAVEYLNDAGKIEAAATRLKSFGFVPTFAPRLLDRLQLQPGAVSADAATGGPAKAAATTAAAAITPPGPTWAEGAPTCLLD